MDMETAIVAIPLVFYFYLLVRWQHVKRPMCYLMGAVGLGLILAAQIFGVGTARALGILRLIFTVIGSLAAFFGAVGACFGAKLPGWAEGAVAKAEGEAPA